MTVAALGKLALTASQVGLFIYGLAAAVVTHAGLWEGADTWQALGIAAVASGSAMLDKWVSKHVAPTK